MLEQASSKKPRFSFSQVSETLSQDSPSAQSVDETHAAPSAACAWPHRCNQAIADLGDSFFPNEPKTVSRNYKLTGHDGVFLVPDADVAEYVKRFSPQVLRYSAKTNCDPYGAMNFGESKGMTFERVLIFPHGVASKWLSSGMISHVEKSATKMYVAATRARYSVAFVYDGRACGIPAMRWVR